MRLFVNLDLLALVIFFFLSSHPVHLGHNGNRGLIGLAFASIPPLFCVPFLSSSTTLTGMVND